MPLNVMPHRCDKVMQFMTTIMGSRVICCLLAVLAGCHAYGKPGAYEGYQVFKVAPKTKEQVHYVRGLLSEPELDFWREAHHIGQSAQFMIPPHMAGQVRTELEQRGIAVQVPIQNMERVIELDRNRVTASRTKISSAAFDYNVFHTYDEIMAEIEELKKRCPTGHICETYSIGKSVEGRDLKMLRIVKNEENRKVYWYDATVHAREWLSTATLLKIADHILTNYDSDSEVKEFLGAGDHYFMFVMNPDGYVYSWTDLRLWRKNRFNNTINRPDENPLGCFGVDLNRNYLHRWGNAGTSYDPCSGIYRGQIAVSEIETYHSQNEIYRIMEEQGQTFELFQTLHSWGQMVLSSWGSVRDPGTEEICELLQEEEQDEVLNVLGKMKVALEATHDNSHDWLVGNGCLYLYPDSGSTQDFARAITGAWWTFTPELRGEDNEGTEYGFIAPETEIQPSFEEMWNAYVVLYRGIADYNRRMTPAPCPINGAQTSTIINYQVVIALGIFSLLLK